jgi:hypothetical protein
MMVAKSSDAVAISIWFWYFVVKMTGEVLSPWKKGTFCFQTAHASQDESSDCRIFAVGSLSSTRA